MKMIASKKGLVDRFSPIKIKRVGIYDCPPIGQYKAHGLNPKTIREICLTCLGDPDRRGIQYIVWCLKQGIFELSKPAMKFLQEQTKILIDNERKEK